MMTIAIRQIKKAAVLVASLLVVSLVLAPLPAQAAVDATDAAQRAVCEGLGQASDADGECNDPDGSAGIGGVIGTVINILSIAVGVIAVIMVIVGGIKYVTSQGDSSGTASAKNTVIYAIVGLIIVALSQVIVRFVVNRTTDTTSGTSTSEVRPGGKRP